MMTTFTPPNSSSMEGTDQSSLQLSTTSSSTAAVRRPSPYGRSAALAAAPHSPQRFSIGSDTASEPNSDRPVIAMQQNNAQFDQSMSVQQNFAQYDQSMSVQHDHFQQFNTAFIDETLNLSVVVNDPQLTFQVAQSQIVAQQAVSHAQQVENLATQHVQNANQQVQAAQHVAVQEHERRRLTESIARQLEQEAKHRIQQIEYEARQRIIQLEQELAEARSRAGTPNSRPPTPNYLTGASNAAGSDQNSSVQPKALSFSQSSSVSNPNTQSTYEVVQQQNLAQVAQAQAVSTNPQVASDNLSSFNSPHFSTPKNLQDQPKAASSATVHPNSLAAGSALGQPSNYIAKHSAPVATG